MGSNRRQKYLKKEHIEKSNLIFENRYNKRGIINEQYFEDVGCSFATSLLADLGGPNGEYGSQLMSSCESQTFIPHPSGMEAEEYQAFLLANPIAYAGNPEQQAFVCECLTTDSSFTPPDTGAQPQLDMAVEALSQQGPVCCDQNSMMYGQNNQGILVTMSNGNHATDTYLMTGQGDTTYCNNLICQAGPPDPGVFGSDNYYTTKPPVSYIKDKRKTTDGGRVPSKGSGKIPQRPINEELKRFNELIKEQLGPNDTPCFDCVNGVPTQVEVIGPNSSWCQNVPNGPQCGNDCTLIPMNPVGGTPSFPLVNDPNLACANTEWCCMGGVSGLQQCLEVQQGMCGPQLGTGYYGGPFATQQDCFAAGCSGGGQGSCLDVNCSNFNVNNNGLDCSGNPVPPGGGYGDTSCCQGCVQTGGCDLSCVDLSDPATDAMVAQGGGPNSLQQYDPNTSYGPGSVVCHLDPALGVTNVFIASANSGNLIPGGGPYPEPEQWVTAWPWPLPQGASPQNYYWEPGVITPQCGGNGTWVNQANPDCMKIKTERCDNPSLGATFDCAKIDGNVPDPQTDIGKVLDIGASQGGQPTFYRVTDVSPSVPGVQIEDFPIIAGGCPQTSGNCDFSWGSPCVQQHLNTGGQSSWQNFLTQRENGYNANGCQHFQAMVNWVSNQLNSGVNASGNPLTQVQIARKNEQLAWAQCMANECGCPTLNMPPISPGTGGPTPPPPPGPSGPSAPVNPGPEAPEADSGESSRGEIEKKEMERLAEEIKRFKRLIN